MLCGGFRVDPMTPTSMCGFVLILLLLFLLGIVWLQFGDVSLDEDDEIL